MNAFSATALVWWARLGWALFLLPVVVMTAVYALEFVQGGHAGFAGRHAMAITIASRTSIAGVVILSLRRVLRNQQARTEHRDD